MERLVVSTLDDLITPLSKNLKSIGSDEYSDLVVASCLEKNMSEMEEALESLKSFSVSRDSRSLRDKSFKKVFDVRIPYYNRELNPSPDDGLSFWRSDASACLQSEIFARYTTTAIGELIGCIALQYFSNYQTPHGGFE